MNGGVEIAINMKPPHQWSMTSGHLTLVGLVCCFNVIISPDDQPVTKQQEVGEIFSPP